jgi:Transposase DDE domain
MSDQYLIAKQEPQAPNWQAEEVAQRLTEQLAQLLSPLLVLLNKTLDKRLVRTFLQTVQTIITFRDRANGLLLSELGGYLLNPAQAPAGTKRLSNLIHSSNWGSWIIEWFLWQQATQQLEAWEQAGYQAIVDWDESRLEKHESNALEGLSPVSSSKAARRTRPRKGYYHPPIGRICVPGMQWLAAVLVSHYPTQGAPRLIAMRWWSSRGAKASYQRDEQGKLLVELLAGWGRRVLHTFDRGFAGKFWLGLCLAYKLRFALRWRGDYQLLDAAGTARASWKIAQGKRAWSWRQLWDAQRQRFYQGSVLALSVRHPDFPEVPLSLVVARGRERPWYLLTAEPIRTEQEAWDLVFAYMRRWHIEEAFRYSKSELAFESPRLWQWEHRVKLLMLATLAYAFLLSLLLLPNEPVRLWLLRHFCHRTGSHCRHAHAPLYRLRSALSRLWQQHPPIWEAIAHLRRPPGPWVTVTEVAAGEVLLLPAESLRLA